MGTAAPLDEGAVPAAGRGPHPPQAHCGEGVMPLSSRGLDPVGWVMETEAREGRAGSHRFPSSPALVRTDRGQQV